MTRTVGTGGTTRAAARRASAAGALVVLTGLLAACGGSGDDTEAEGEPGSSESAEAESPEATDEAEETEAPEETTDPEDLEPTPPDTVLDPDEPAIVEVVYTGSGRGLYELELVSVEGEPLSSLPPDVPTEQGSTLYYVTQDWTMLDRGKGNVQAMNLKAQTSVSVGQDFQILPVLFADTPGCEPAQFRPEDGTSGKTRRHCSAYLLPPGDQLKQVWFYEVNSPYDYSTGGAPVRWRVDL